MRIGILGIGFLVTIQSAAVHADSFKDVIDAAYCIGVDQGEIDYNVKMRNLKNYPTEELQSKNSQREAFVNSAMRTRLIDAATVQKMKSAGYRESVACWKKADECADGLKTLSKAQMAECVSSKDALCEPITVCDEK